MEEVEDAIRNLRRRQEIREENFKNLEDEQEAEYQRLLEDLRATKEEGLRCKEQIAKNFRLLTGNVHTIRDLVQNAEQIPGLPISRESRREAIGLFKDGIEIVNNSRNILRIFGKGEKQNSADPTSLIDSITAYTNAVGNELHRVKTSIVQAEILKRNVEMLEEQCNAANDETVDA